MSLDYVLKNKIYLCQCNQIDIAWSDTEMCKKNIVFVHDA